MDGIEQVRLYLKTHPEMLKRALVVVGILLVGIPLVWWQIYSSEEKAYILFTNGYYYYKNQNMTQAQGALGNLVALYPHSKFAPMSRYYLGLSYLSSRQFEEASAQLQYFMEENPKHFMRERVYAIWMASELDAGRPERAIELADRFEGEFGMQSPAAAEVLYRKGVALLQVDRRTDADKCFEQAATTWKDGNIFGSLAFYAQTSRPSM